tara:strand:- start:8476 stop:10515 length:2040 start_codon:yes stop_codon:yes gene_type:complete
MSLSARLSDLKRQYNALSVAKQNDLEIGGRLLMQIRQTEEQISRATGSINKQKAATDKLKDSTDEATSIIKKMGEVAQHAGGAIGGVADAAYSGTGAFADLNKSITSTIDLTKSGGALLGELIPTSLIKRIPEGFNKSMGYVAKASEYALDVAQDTLGLFGKVTAAVDATTASHRRQVAAIFDVGKQYGGSIGNAEKFTSSMRNAVSSEFGKSVNLRMGDMDRFMRSVSNTNLTLKDMSESTSIAGSQTSALAAATAQYKALGIINYVDNLNDMVKGQGMTMQESIETFALFGDTAKETGLNVNQVSRTLMSTANNFQKLGMSAEFGTPILKGFTNSLKDMGLGVENALGLTTSLSTALGKLTEDYGLAYLTFQRGGLEIGGATGGGGMLNTSIQLQAEMLEAEKTGDQTKIASQMVKGMRDTIASFTGGDIVTVKEAAEDTSLQNAFYMQQQMLSSQYGISGADATRTLEMLAKLDEANARGDTKTAQSLEKQIQEQKKAEDKTLSIQEKMGIGISQSAASLEEQTIMMKMQVRRIYDEKIGEKVVKAISAAGKATEEAFNSDDKEGTIENVRKGIDDFIKKMNAEQEAASKSAAAESKKKIENKNKEFLDTVMPGKKGADKKGAGTDGEREDLKTAIDKLVAYLDKPQKLTISFSENAKDILQVAKDARAAKGGTGR